MSKRLALLVALVAAGPSLAEAGPYLGIGIGSTRTEASLTDLGLFPGPVLPVPTPPLPDPNYTGSDDFTSTDVAIDVAAGWMFGWFGIEVGYTDFGSAEQRYTLPESCTPLPNGQECQSREWTAKMEMTAYRAYLVGSLPLSESIDGYVKLGAISWEADYSGYERSASFVSGPPIGPQYEPVSFDDDDTGLAGALGINIKTDSPFSLRLEASYYDVDTTDVVWNAQLMGVYTF
jgi:opacity protein-like surface antigen